MPFINVKSQSKNLSQKINVNFDKYSYSYCLSTNELEVVQSYQLMPSILELELKALFQREKKDKKSNRSPSFSAYEEESYSRSRNKSSKTKNKTKNTKQKALQLKSKKSGSFPLTQKNSENEKISQPLKLQFLIQEEQSNYFFKLECAKLVQANTLLTHIIAQNALEKYMLQEQIFTKMQQIERIQQKNLIKFQKQAQNTE